MPHAPSGPNSSQVASGRKPRLRRHLDHQAQGALAIAQAGEDLGIDLLVEAAEQDLGMQVQKLVTPGGERVAFGQPRRRQFVQVHFHFVALEVADRRHRGHDVPPTSTAGFVFHRRRLTSWNEPILATVAPVVKAVGG